jgi:hypothetical protein
MFSNKSRRSVILVRSEDWETDSEDEEQDTDSVVLSITEPLYIADVVGGWETQIAEEIILVPGIDTKFGEAKEDWRTKIGKEELEVPAEAYFGYSSFV